MLRLLVVARDHGLLARVETSVQIHWPCADVRSVGVGQWAVQATREHAAQVILLDAAIGGVSAETIATIRRDGTRVIPLVADEREITRSDALAEVDDYVIKPFCPLELVARIDVALRRAEERAEAPDLDPLAGEAGIFDDGVLSLDFDRRRARLHQRAVFVTNTEFDLLAPLLHYQGFVVPNRTLLESACGKRADEQTDYLWIHMRRLCNKIEPNPANPRYVIAERGVGYRFARPLHATPGCRDLETPHRQEEKGVRIFSGSVPNPHPPTPSFYRPAFTASKQLLQ